MGQAIRKFVARAPRYVLRPHDNQMLRFSSNSDQNRSYSTKLMNVSETGLAFLIDRGSSPHIGEFIKVEFPIPGGEQIAWFAKVQRLEEFTHHPWWSSKLNLEHRGDIIVGVHFHEMPEGHRAAIREHLEARFREESRERKGAIVRWAYDLLQTYGWTAMMYVLATLFAAALMYFITQPSANYDANRGAPWGQRFK